MNKLLVGGFALALTGSAAMAADMRVKAPVMAPAFSWNGCYVGIEGGGAWGRSKHSGAGAPGFGNLADFTPWFNISGGLVGGEVGCNMMVGNSTWVFGVETDASWSNKKGSSFETGFAGVPTFLDETKERWLSTSRMRIGPSWGALWIYATGGFAAAQIDASVTVSAPPALFATTFHSNNITQYGWTAGAGFEYAFWGTWSIKAEYLYVRLENQDFTFLGGLAGGTAVAPVGLPPFGFPATRTLNVDDHIVRVGLNWRFMGLGFLAP